MPLPIARLLEKQLRDELGADELRSATGTREQWGRDTRRYCQCDWIEQQLVDTGWRPAGTITGCGPLLSTGQVAARIGKSESRARTLMVRGDIVAMRRLSGHREVWVAHEADVQRYLAELAGTSLPELAAELGLEYHQAWQLAGDLGLMEAGRRSGTRVRLSATSAARLRAEVERRRTVQSQTMTVREVAEELRMAITLVETLIRRGQLVLVDGPTDARRRYVSRASVEAYLAVHPIPIEDEAPTEDDHLLTCTQAARLARISRPQLTTLTATYQIRTGTKPENRHVYVTAFSLIAWAERTGQVAVADAVRRLAARTVR